MQVWKSDIPLGKLCPSIGVMLEERLHKRPEHIILKEKAGKEFHAFRWYELYHEVSLVGTSLLHLGLKKGDRVGVISKNGKGMLVLELAVMSVGGISVPVFSEYPFPQLEHTLGNAMPKYVVVDSLAHLEEFAKTEISKNVERIFLIEDASSLPPRLRRNVSAFGELYDMARDTSLFEKAAKKIQADDPCLIQYTSGTTGLPKGVVLSHGNILSQRKAQEHLWNLAPSDRFLSYLPWHHSFGGIFERFTALYFSCCLALDDSGGKDLSLLIRNFVAIKPTVYFSVPKIYQSLVNECLHSKKLEKDIFHPDIKFFFTAAAPLPKDVDQYITSKNIPIVEGWGLTETSPCVTLTPLGEERCAHVVGQPIPGVKIKIGPGGEILVKGPNVMKGYFRMAERTKDVFTRDSWFRTGDLGERSPKGLLLKGRKDGLFKLSNGEKIFSQILETQLVGSSHFIEQAILAGSGHDFVSALIFPDFKELAKYLKRRRVGETDRLQIIRHGLVRELYLKELKRINEDIYPHYSRIRAFVLIPDELSLFRGELTPSLKVVKPVVLQNYASLTESIYHPDKSEKRLLEEIIKIEEPKEIESAMRLT